ncbi:MAG: C39 family peptidase [Candidatus Thorarchaeota archaeon]
MRVSSSRILSIVVVMALLAVPSTTTDVTESIDESVESNYVISSEGYGSISGVPYVWQEMNGFCQNAAVTMAINAAGVPLSLHDYFAVSGIGFSMAYIRLDDTLLFLPGSIFRQQFQLIPTCELYGLNHSIYLDSTYEWTATIVSAWQSWGINATLIDGEDEAFNILKENIDTGTPVVLWVDPYFLPAVDYDLARQYGEPQDPTAPAGHAILAVGYNDTAGTVEIMDPGVGSFGEDFGYPDDGRWSYSMNYSELVIAWSQLAYGITLIKPGSGRSADFNSQLVDHAANRLLGDWSEYAPDTEEQFFALFGESAFRGLSLDMTVTGIASFLEELDTFQQRRNVLFVMGFELESMIMLQYLSFRTALEALTGLMPDVDLTEVLETGRIALPHFDVLSDNRSMTDPFYGEDFDSLLTTTFVSISESYETSFDYELALDEYSEELNVIAEHLLAIADSWKATGEALQAALTSNGFSVIHATVSVGAVSAILIVLVILRRRR